MTDLCVWDVYTPLWCVYRASVNFLGGQLV